MSNILVITNDFPPRYGGIETFSYEMVRRFPEGKVVVLTSKCKSAKDWDASQNYPIIRINKVLLPTFSTLKTAVKLIEKYQCDKIWFASAAPLALLAKSLRKKTNIKKIVATTHGHEVWWVKLPVTKKIIKKISANVDVLTYISEYTKNKIKYKINANNFVKLQPAVNINDYQKISVPNWFIDKYKLQNKKIVLCVGRLVQRKGQDRLISALTEILMSEPTTLLILVGTGKIKNKLTRKVKKLQLSEYVQFIEKCSSQELQYFYSAARVFAMPCRSRLLGLDEEGLGIVYLEAAAAKLPVIAGNSGGAPETVVPGVTGFVIKPTIVNIAAAVKRILGDTQLAQVFSSNGRKMIELGWTWDATYLELNRLLSR